MTPEGWSCLPWLSSTAVSSSSWWPWNSSVTLSMCTSRLCGCDVSTPVTVRSEISSAAPLVPFKSSAASASLDAFGVASLDALDRVPAVDLLATCSGEVAIAIIELLLSIYVLCDCKFDIASLASMHIDYAVPEPADAKPVPPQEHCSNKAAPDMRILLPAFLDAAFFFFASLTILHT